MRTGQRSAAGPRESGPQPDASGDGSPSAELESLVKDLRSDLRRIRDGLKRIIQVEWRRLQVRGIDALFRTLIILCLLGFCFAASITAAILIAYGIREALVGWTQAVWIGNLGAGIGILAIAIGVGLAFRNRLRDSIVRAAKRDGSETP